MPRFVQASESSAARRRAYFDVRLASDGMSPALSEAAGQPQISIDGAAFTATGIGPLVSIGFGRYYAELTTGVISASGSAIETRYKGASTAETPGDSFQVVGFDPAVFDADGMREAIGMEEANLDTQLASKPNRAEFLNQNEASDLIEESYGDLIIESTGGITNRKAMALILSALAGIVSMDDNGDETFTLTFKAPGTSTTRLSMLTNAAGERLSTTISPPA